MKLPELTTHDWNEDSLAETLGDMPTARAVKALPELLETLHNCLIHTAAMRQDGHTVRQRKAYAAGMHGQILLALTRAGATPDNQ